MLFENPKIERAVDRYSNLQAASAAWIATQKRIKIRSKKKKKVKKKKKKKIAIDESKVGETQTEKN